MLQLTFVFPRGRALAPFPALGARELDPGARGYSSEYLPMLWLGLVAAGLSASDPLGGFEPPHHGERIANGTAIATPAGSEASVAACASACLLRADCVCFTYPVRSIVLVGSEQFRIGNPVPVWLLLSELRVWMEQVRRWPTGGV